MDLRSKPPTQCLGGRERDLSRQTVPYCDQRFRKFEEKMLVQQIVVVRIVIVAI